MSRRRDRDGDGLPDREPNVAPADFNSPFRGLAARLGPLPSAPAAKPPPAPPAKPKPPPPATDGSLFAEAVRGVRAIPAEERARRTQLPRREAAPRGLSEEQLVMSELSDLVAGIAEFDVSDTDEHMEGAVVRFDPRLMRRLRAGELAYQSHLDLHGLTAEEGHRALVEFVLRAMSLGQRCVLVIHGRGLNSPGQRSVLKNGVKEWLTQGELGRRVLAFSSARPYDGGAGATYVLLRRERRSKKPFRTYEGTRG
jgi:DNA-nicking Smr family endonuclease